MNEFGRIELKITPHVAHVGNRFLVYKPEDSAEVVTQFRLRKWRDSHVVGADGVLGVQLREHFRGDLPVGEGGMLKEYRDKKSKKLFIEL